MTHWIFMLFGCAIGGCFRHGVSDYISHRLGERFPWGTLFVNISGSFAIGIFLALTLPKLDSLMSAPAWHSFVTVGFLGAYTTYSSFSLQTYHLARSGRLGHAGINIAATIGACLFAVLSGYSLGNILIA
jgi:fluoride exporter